MSEETVASVICGATGTIGAVVARALAARGQRLVLVARQSQGLSVLEGTLPECETLALPLDLLDDTAPAALVEGTRRHGWTVENIIFAAGGFPRTPLIELTAGEIERAVRVHAIAPMMIVRALAADLRASRGAVVACGDAGIDHPYPNHAAYLAAKGALVAGMRALAVDLAPEVRINCVGIGIVSGGESTLPQKVAERGILRRPGLAEDVGHVILALLDSRWVTGEVWHARG